MRKQKRIPYESCIIIYFFLQLIYVYAKGTCVSVSDEYTYKQIAMDIFQGEAVSSFHYPFVYPFILSLSFYFGDAFYNVMLFENILLKTILLAVIFKMLASVVENREDRGLVLTLIAFSPSYFLYSDWIMAENLFSPLLLITILYYISRRNIMISDTIALKNKLSSSAIAGALAVALLKDIKIYFQHYKTEEEAKAKWNERAKRMDYDKLFILFTDRDGCTEQDIVEFDNLPYKNKVIFVNKPHPNIKSAVYIRGFENDGCVGPCMAYKSKISYKKYYDDFDYVEWFNSAEK